MLVALVSEVMGTPNALVLITHPNALSRAANSGDRLLQKKKNVALAVSVDTFFLNQKIKCFPCM